MSLAYVQFVVAIVVGIVASCTGLMIAIAVLMPAHTARAEQALHASPKRCFYSGLAVALALGVGLLLVNVPNGLVKLLALAIMFGVGALLGVGGAGIAQLMGKRIGDMADMAGAHTDFGALVRGSIVFNLAVLFPLIGWSIFAPIAAIFAAGAGAIAVRPEPSRRPIVPPLTPASGFDVSRVA